MKLKYLSGILLLATALFIISCDDDDYTVRTGEVISEVTTGDATVTAISAEVQGVVKNLSSLSSSSYEVGAYYSTDTNPTASGTKRSGSIDEVGQVTAIITGLTTGTTYYYAIYVTLQNKVTTFGEIKSFVATDAKVTTNDATDITYTKAMFSSSMTGTDGLESFETGVKLALSPDAVTSGMVRELSVVDGLLPGTTYYYAAFAKIGDGYVYGETKTLTTIVQQIEYIDMGLSVMWAKSNIGAEEESEAGALFGYGDQTAMLTTTSLGSYPSSDIAGTADDIIYNLDLDEGSPMKSQMPTQAQITELINNTTQEWTTVDGVQGMRFTANNGNSIFLPAAGYRDEETTVSDEVGYYWSGTVDLVNNEYSNTLTFNVSSAQASTSRRYLGLSLRSVRPYAEVNPDSDNLVFGDIESNGCLRIEIYNEYGDTGSNPPIDPTSIRFSNNMIVTFTLTGITDNLRSGAAGSYVGGIEYVDASWSASYWSDLSMGIYEAMITGDGTYTVWMETLAEANGAAVFCIDIADLGVDIADWDKVGVEVNFIKFDADVEQVVNNSIVSFVDDGSNGRIEIYNEYGSSSSQAPQYYDNRLKFNGMMLVEFTITGIDGNLVSDASNSYFTELSYAAASWYPSYWGGADYGSVTVTGDGTYQVYTYLDGGDCVGAVVWTIELYNLWDDLVDTSLVNATINRVITPGKQ